MPSGKYLYVIIIIKVDVYKIIRDILKGKEIRHEIIKKEMDVLNINNIMEYHLLKQKS